MTKHEIHLRFMEAAIQGITASKAFDSQINGRHQAIINYSLKYADAALEAYLACWPNIQFED